MDKRENCLAVIERVNDFWITNNPEPGENSCYTNAQPPYTPRNGWDMSVYFMGCMAAWRAVGKAEYVEYALKWAEKYAWQTFEGDPAGGSTFNADSQACGNVYFELARIFPQHADLNKVLNNLEYCLDNAPDSIWSWVDAVFMGAQLYGRAYRLTGDERYLEKMHILYLHIMQCRGCYDSSEALWYRDETFFYPGYKSKNGKKELWSRGNGWIFAATALMIKFLPQGDKKRDLYKKVLQDMAKTLGVLQGKDGFWRASLLDAEAYPMPETSGTALITYGLALGLNSGILKDTESAFVAERAWEGMNSIAVTPEGRVGYAQPGGDRPADVKFSNTNDFTTGAFLLAGEQMAQYYQQRQRKSETGGRKCV